MPTGANLIIDKVRMTELQQKLRNLVFLFDKRNLPLSLVSQSRVEGFKEAKKGEWEMKMLKKICIEQNN